MKIALLAIDSKRPNLALMKIAAYHRNLGDDVQWYDSTCQYDRLYMSKIFNFTPDFTGDLSNVKEIIKGGTGYSISSQLPIDIEYLQPDYSIYPDIAERDSLGFLTRGCPNHCKWCVVPLKEGGIRPYMDIEEITQNGKRPYATLMDNNILAAGDYCLEQLDKIIAGKYHVDFNQALDARLITEQTASQLAKMKWINSVIRFGCDTAKQMEECENAIQMIMGYGFRGQFSLYTMLHGDINECIYRLSYWKKDPYRKKVRIQAQPYRDPNQVNDPPKWQRHMARWANRKEFYTTSEFVDFQFTKTIKGSDYLNTQPE